MPRKPIGEVGGTDPDVRVDAACELGQRGDLPLPRGARRADQLGQQLLHGRRIGRGLLGDHIVGVIAIAEQLCAPGTQHDDLAQQLPRVELVVARASGDRGVEDPLPGPRIGQFGQHGLTRGQFQADQVAGLVTGLGRGTPRRGDLAGTEPVEPGDVVDEHRRGIGVVEDLL